MDQITIEKMKYKKDSLSYALVLLGLAINVFYFFALYKNNSNFYYTLQIGISVLYNLIFMLAVFLSAENIKNYNRKYSIVVAVIAILQIVRMFGYPLQALKADELSSKRYFMMCVYLGLSSMCLLSGAIVSYIKSTLLKRFVANELVTTKE